MTAAIVRIKSKASLDSYARTAELLGNAPVDPFTEDVDEHLVSIDGNQRCIGCCSLWWRNCPDLEGEDLACIGHFYAHDREAGEALMNEACKTLKQQGATLAIGPMNGNTWRKYRFVTENSGRQPFALEPRNPEWWPKLWVDVGFSPLARYHSSVIGNLEVGDARAARAWSRLESIGIRVRTLNKDDFENELKQIFSVSEKSFVSNYLYTPTSERSFICSYLPFKDFLDPRLVLIAEHNEKPVGFVFCLPDRDPHRSGDSSDTLIIKTLAVLPGRTYAGLGTVMVDRMRETAKALGFQFIIHALMHDGNDSANIGKNSQIFRRYTLFSKPLSQ